MVVATSSTRFLTSNFSEEERHLARFDLGEVEDVVDEAQQVLARGVYFLQVGNEGLLAGVFELFLQHFAVADDGVERRAQLMAHVGKELALRAIRFFRGVLGFEQLVLALAQLRFGGPCALAFFLRLRPFHAQAPGDVVEGCDDLAELVARLACNDVLHRTADHAVRGFLQPGDRAHDARVERDPQIEHEQQHQRGKALDKVLPAGIQVVALLQQHIELCGIALPQTAVGRLGLADKTVVSLSVDRDVLGLDHSASVRREKVGHGVVIRLKHAPQSGLEITCGVVGERDRHAGPRVFQGRLDQSGQAYRFRAFFRRQILACQKCPAHDAGLRQQISQCRQLQHDAVHQVISVEVRVEDQTGSVSDMRVEIAQVGKQLRVQLVAVGRTQIEHPRLQEALIFLEDIEFLCRLQAASERLLDPLDLPHVLLDLRLHADQIGTQAHDAFPIRGGKQAALPQVFLELPQWTQVLRAGKLLMGEFDALVDLRDQQVHDHCQRQDEQEADQEELPGIVQTVHDRACRREQRARVGKRFLLGETFHGTVISMATSEASSCRAAAPRHSSIERHSAERLSLKVASRVLASDARRRAE